MDSNKIGKFIYTLRKEKNLSQYQLAEMIPISRQAVSKWERGVTIPDSSTLLRLSEIFDVTINELLNGKRLQENSIENLESTTLEIIDQHNIKKKKDKRIIVILGTIIFILIFSFLLYYFITSYSSIKVYKVGGTNEEIDLYDGLFIVTKEKAYLKLGKIKNRTDEIIKINVILKKKNKEILVYQDLDIDEIIIIYNGYNECVSSENIKYFLNNSFLEIVKKNMETERIKLIFKRDFVNNNFLYNTKKNIDKDNNTYINNESNEINVIDAINIIKENGIYENDSYIFTYKNTKYIYLDNIELLRIITEDNNTMDLFVKKKQYICSSSAKSNSQECIKYTKKYIKKLNGT